MAKTIQLKNTKLLYLYWAAVLATGAVALIVTLTVKSVSVARIINFACLIAFLLAFFGGYIDFQNYKPLKSAPKALYIAAGMISLTLILFQLNVETITPFRLLTYLMIITVRLRRQLFRYSWL